LTQEAGATLAEVDASLALVTSDLTDRIAEVWTAGSRTLTADPGAAAHVATQDAVAAVPGAVWNHTQ
jgi:hypothetical protein